MSLSVRLFSGLVGEAASTPILFTPALLHGFNLTIGFVYFYKVSFQHLGLLAKTWGLRSVLKGSYFWSSLSDIFPEEAPKLSAKYISCQFMRELLRFFLPLDILDGLLSCCQIVSHVWTGQSLEGSPPFLIVPLMVQCLQHFWMKLIFDWKRCTGKSPTWLFLLVSYKRRFRWVAYLFFDRLFGVSIFHHVMWGGEDKMEVIEEFVINVLLFFY